ncbi:dehydrogenase/reductase SDR family member 12-like [Takifugu flavidus]|uniref:Dehydrogenase/reductase SDR family member 12 n=1 Tax=Takifugu flavidus TaxID=433684 RepID=A0A5C6P2Y8_9TELE|nr:dehydrogenase/reductase SDR family member 12-like [Takifugu flavidus]TWW73259.1 Dehydrogenase/reductase SDR family member 12 [Takifugu flavidus]|eukprot:XP_003975649.1 PREDICTED: dehydrogenase/reductase SDR family member 12-like [Takifugu rubripes]
MSLYRNAVWFLNGIHQYTRKGYEAAAKDFDTQDLDVSVVGRSFMITGANSGIGRATAMAVAQKGGTVHMVCRNKDRAEAAREVIVNESGNTEVYVHIVDMEETRQVWEFAEAFKQQHRTLNVLINNAGCMVHKRETNAEGLEKNFATNTMGVYILTESLIPLLQKSRDPRVITVSSGGMLVQKLRADDLQSEKGFFDSVMVYAQNKRQQVVLTQHWAKANPVIHFSVMHPGWVDTPAVSKSMPQFHRMMGERLRRVEQGADTVVWLALSRAAARTQSGQFFQDRRCVPTHLPLAWTHSAAEDIQAFIIQLDALAAAIRSQPDAEPDAHTHPATPETL